MSGETTMKALTDRIIALLISFAVGVESVIVVSHVYDLRSAKISAQKRAGDDTGIFFP